MHLLMAVPTGSLEPLRVLERFEKALGHDGMVQSIVPGMMHLEDAVCTAAPHTGGMSLEPLETELLPFLAPVEAGAHSDPSLVVDDVLFRLPISGAPFDIERDPERCGEPGCSQVVRGYPMTVAHVHPLAPGEHALAFFGGGVLETTP
jgi:hypothetical protein